MPHTCNAWGINTEYANTPIHIQEMSAVRLSFHSENFHILLEGLRKHFIICLTHLFGMHSKIKKNFANKQHSILQNHYKCIIWIGFLFTKFAQINLKNNIES